MEANGRPRQEPRPLSGNERDYVDVVLRKHGRILLGYATKQLGNKAKAEDLVAETFLSFIRSIGRPETNPVIAEAVRKNDPRGSDARRIIWDILKKRKNDLFRKKRLDEVVDAERWDRLMLSLADEGPTAEDYLASGEILSDDPRKHPKFLIEMRKRNLLTLVEQTTLLLIYRGYDDEEIAETRAVSIKTVENTRSKILQKTRSHFFDKAFETGHLTDMHTSVFSERFQNNVKNKKPDAFEIAARLNLECTTVENLLSDIEAAIKGVARAYQ